MNISAINIPKDNIGFNMTQTVSRSSTGDVENKVSSAPTDEKSGKEKDLKPDLKKVKQMTEAMNQFIEAMDAHIRFSLHQKTNELMVQVVDQSNNKVLKEFPSHEFLDTVAAIRSYVGILLDKKI